MYSISAMNINFSGGQNELRGRITGLWDHRDIRRKDRLYQARLDLVEKSDRGFRPSGQFKRWPP